MSNESGMQLAELRDLTHHGIAQMNRAAVGWIEVARGMLDPAETNVSAFCDHARKMSHAASPAECVRLQTEFFGSSIAAMQKQAARMMKTESEAAE